MEEEYMKGTMPLTAKASALWAIGVVIPIFALALLLF
jgi:hypothetical protein